MSLRRIQELLLLFINCLNWSNGIKIETFTFPDAHQGRFVRDLDAYEVVYPSLRDKDGQFLSHGLHNDHTNRLKRQIYENKTDSQYINDMSNQLVYQLNAFGKDLKFKLEQNRQFFAEGLIIEKTSGEIHTVSPACYYKGSVMGKVMSNVAISNCKGLEGIIRDGDGDDIMIEPVKGIGPHADWPNPHLIYKPKHMRQARAIDHSKNNGCGVTGEDVPRSKRSTERSRNVEKAFRRAARRRRSLSTERFVETLVVVDQAMLDFYEGQSLEQYVLTVMNMVASLYHDASLGAAVHIVVVRVIILDSVQEGFSVTHNADNTLEGFCQWSSKVNPSSEYHPQHHDVAILLTRVDICRGMNRPCGTLGLSQVNGLCTRSRSCSINEDSGLSVAYTIAHELGHNFGMEHDGVGNNCPKKVEGDKFIMSPMQSLSKHPYLWSNCSRHYVTRFLDKGWGWCLDDEPSQYRYKYSTLLPGVIYDFDHQCRMRHGPQSGVCQVQWIQNSDPCSRLWCRFEYENVTTCVMRVKPAADGTYCKEGHWCYRGTCVEKSPLPDAIDGGWGKWNTWSECSRSCGGGVRTKKRSCDNPRPQNGGKYCLGKYKKYRICNSEECPLGQPSFRNLQCQQYASSLYKNEVDPKAEIESVYLKDRPCELLCHRQNSLHSIKVAEEVKDGTSCREGKNDVCIAGKCEPVGCDWKLRSKAKQDKCGICHGDGSTCQTIKSQFNKTDLSEGAYVETAFIPAGARNIRVEEVIGAKNYLALKSSGGQFYLNGHWQVQGTGNYVAAGTNIFYSRHDQKDFLQAIGPTKEDMHVLLFVQGPNPGVNIEFTIPRTNETTLSLFYKWQYSDWSACSAPCGIGEQSSVPECKELETGSTVDDEYCNEPSKSANMVRACNTNICPPEWWIGSWQKCSRLCGYGVSRRSVMCIRRLKQDEQLALRDEECNRLERPQGQSLCYNGKCTATWLQGNWSECSSTCGLGMQHRTVKCSSSNQELCYASGSKPVSVRLCNGTGCPRWSVGEFKKCSVPCGLGVQKRNVFCVAGKDGAIIDDNGCDLKLRPSHDRKCAREKCLQWAAGEWGKCSQKCGNGTQKRNVFCPGESYQCELEAQPPTTRSCVVRPCELWKTGPWGQCSKSCVQWRTVVCKHVDSMQNAFTCSKSSRPAVTQSCKSGLCRTSAAALNHDCQSDLYGKRFCQIVKVAKYCPFPKFRFSCCRTCYGD